MKKTLPLLTLIRLSMLCATITISQHASAAELSPWMGSDDQAPFQLDPTTMVAVTFAADPLHTGSTDKVICEPTGCTKHLKTAKDEYSESGSPQN